MEKLEAGNFYHIYNCGINATNLFLEKNNFNFFMNNYAYYSLISMETYAYCLMKNHFHFLVKLRTPIEQYEVFNKYRELLEDNENKRVPNGCEYKSFKKQKASRQLGHLCDKYAKNFNGWNQRTGKLFETPFKRRRIEDEYDLIQMICYIHRNPIHHGITQSYTSYPYTSHKIFINDLETWLEKDKVLNFFGGIDQFIASHKEMKLKITSNLKLED